MSRNTYRIVVVFVLACLITVSAYALPLSSSQSLEPKEPAVFAAVWAWIASRLPGLTAVWQQAGCQMDPDGRPRDEGCQMDPNG